VLDVVGGLDAAHAAGILHRDVKPSNCFIDHEGLVKIGDFGLSISTLSRDVRFELAGGGFQGTPQFAAPEQLRGEPLDLRADIYAVGATLYYLLTGRPPFDDTDLRQLVTRVSDAPAPSLRTVRPEIAPGLARLVLQCLSKRHRLARSRTRCWPRRSVRTRVPATWHHALARVRWPVWLTR
jgi:serine/threonine protein kinase